MSTKSIEAFAAHRRQAKTLPPPPDTADHILQRVAQRRAFIQKLQRETDELERAALKMRELAHAHP